jgi:hypothetical protein
MILMNKAPITLSILTNFYNKNGRSPKKREIRECQTFQARYRTWNNALKAAGLPLLRKNKHTKKELIASLQRFKKENKRSPRASDCNTTNYLFDTKTYFKILGCKSWADVLRCAKLNIYFNINRLSNKELQKRYITFSQKNGYKNGATERALDESGLPFSSAIFRAHFGSVNRLRKKCGYKIIKIGRPRKYTELQVFKLLNNIYDKYNGIPSVKEFKKISGISIASIFRYCQTESLNVAFKKARKTVKNFTIPQK